MLSVASSSGRSELRSSPTDPTVSPSAESSVSPAPSNDYALPTRVDTGCLPSVNVLNWSLTPVFFRIARLNPPLGQTSQPRAICQEIRLVVVMFWHTWTTYAPRSFCRVPFCIFMPPLAPLRFLDGSMVGSRAQLESTMRLDELAETCTTPAGIETITFTHLPQPCDSLLSTDWRVLRQRATNHHGDDCADPTGLLSPSPPPSDVSPDPLSSQIPAAIASQSLNVAVETLSSLTSLMGYSFLSASTCLERDAAAAGCRAGDMNHDATLRRPLFRKGQLFRSVRIGR